VETITYDRAEPSGFFYELSRLIGQSNGRIFVDISAMSRLLIVQVICGFKEIYRQYSRLVIIYSEAEKYYPTEQDIKSSKQVLLSDSFAFHMFPSWGLINLSVLPELNSTSMVGQPAHLIIFPSFNPMYLSAIRSEIQPSFLTIINGVPPSPENKWRLESIRRINRIEEILKDEYVAEYFSSTLYYIETFQIILEIYSLHSVYDKLIIAPTGSKMQAVAIGLIRSFLDDISIIYPTPKSFAKEYTSGIKNLYRIDLGTASKYT